MARKVLINRHTSGSSAPNAAEMYLGEIAVAHETGKETLFTKNNKGDMVPFISCAQTISIINSKIQASEDDVKTDTRETHLTVATADTSGAKVWTITTDDVQSEEEFKAYSAETKTRIDKNVSAITDTLGIISALTNVVVTDISGDTIIVAEKVDATTGSNSYNLTHKQAPAAIATGFNKLATDAYGHVTASTAVEAADIEGLGFKNSAWTEEKITEAIEGLDSSSATTDNRHYVTAITIENGKIVSFGEATDPQLSVESAGTGNVVSQITVADHKISYTTTSVATSEDIQKLSAATMSLSGVVGDFSGATNTKFNELSAYTEDVDDKVKALSAGTIQLSADTVAYVNQLSGYAHGEIVELSGATVSAFTAILGMDKAADAENGKVVTTVAETDGVVTETKANVKDLQLGGYEKDTTATGDIASTDTINTALSKLENKANANAISNADGSINVTTAATGTDINVNIKSGEHVLAKDGNAGLYTNIKLSAVTASSDLVKEEYVLYGTDNTILGDHIKIYKDQSLVSITLEDNDGSGHTGQYLKYTYIDASGDTQSTYVNVSSFLVEAEFKSGVTADASGVVHGVVDPTSEGFLTVGADGFKVSGVQAAIDAKVNALDVTDDTAVAGQYVAAIEETDGVVAVKTRANVSEAVLNGYAKGSDAGAVAATDTVNQAISKLENQVDKAKAAATTKVVEGTDAGNNMTITPTTSTTDGSVTYTVDLTDIASKTALDAEIAARKAVDGQNGDTYAANASTNFISGATSLNDADVKLDTAIKNVADQVNNLDYTGLTNENTKVVTDVKQEDGLVSASATAVGDLVITAITTADTKVAANDSLATIAGKLQGQIDAMDSSSATTDSGHYITAITITDGKITAVGEEALPAATPVTTANGTTGDTVAPVLVGITPGGTEGHELTLNYTNKVLSAQTADEAAHASAATKVDQKLTFADDANDVEYDGSEAQTITFGTTVSSTGITGRSMSITNGVVDVEIIDCGEY